MLTVIGLLAAGAAMVFGYRLAPFVFDGFLSRRYEELFRAADVWEMDRRFERVVVEFSSGN